MKSTRVDSFTVNAWLISFSAGEVLKRFRHDFHSLEVEDRRNLAPVIASELMKPSESQHALSETLNHQEIVEANDAQLQMTRYGAPDGPRKPRKNYNGEDPLDFPGHEALATFLATPRTERKFKTLTALAEDLEISRMTIHRWKKDLDVLRRANWLVRGNKLSGDLIARREWQGIVEAQVAPAKRGSTAAAKFLERGAWPEDQRANSPDINLRLGEAIEATENTEDLPSWLEEQSDTKETPLMQAPVTSMKLARADEPRQDGE